MRVIATAGHVDHGKSTLVKALTGINPDRLREEQQREMTLDLGFAWMNLATGEPVGIIDVPGHIDFIDNMLAGVGGIDMALLVIAADEGAMPQTREHLAILQLLRAERAVVALTKCDMVDAEWIELMRADIGALLKDTPLHAAPIVPVSARANQGLKALVAAMTGVLGGAPPRRDLGKPRLPVDRVFTMQGFGTVVTGTLVEGALSVGDAVEVITQRGTVLQSHVRGLQTHKQKLERALPGSRVAINLTGVSVEDAARGSVVARPGTLQATTLADVEIELLAGVELPLKHNAEVKVFSGAAMCVARVWLLAGTAIQPGQTGRAQLQCVTPMPLTNGDRLIIRLPSPSITLGGGTVLDAHPALRYRRRSGKADDAVLARLEALSQGTPEDRLISALDALGFATHADARQKAQLETAAFESALQTVIAQQTALESNGLLGLRSRWQLDLDRAALMLAAFHAKAPLTLGMSKESLRSQMKLTPRVFDALLSSVPAQSMMRVEGEIARLVTHEVIFSQQQQRAVDMLLKQCADQPWNTPLVKDAKAALGDAVYAVLVQRRQFVQLNDDVFLLRATYEHALESVRAFIAREGSLTAAQARDLFSTTRKYALALLEQFDAIGVTKRVGDARVLKQSTE